MKVWAHTTKSNFSNGTVLLLVGKTIRSTRNAFKKLHRILKKKLLHNYVSHNSTKIATLQPKVNKLLLQPCITYTYKSKN